MTSWASGDLLEQEGGSTDQKEMLRLQLAGHARVLGARAQQRHGLGLTWQRLVVLCVGGPGPPAQDELTATRA